MLRMFSRAQGSHTHLVRPRSIPGDHPSGGGSESERVPQRWHTTSGTAASLAASAPPRGRNDPAEQSDPLEARERV